MGIKYLETWRQSSGFGIPWSIDSENFYLRRHTRALSLKMAPIGKTVVFTQVFLIPETNLLTQILSQASYYNNVFVYV